MRQMAHDRHHAVMMLGVHRLDLAAGAAPELADALDGRGIGAGRRHHQAPAPLEQGGEPAIRARIFGAGHGVGRDEMDVPRQQGRHVPDDGHLGAADVGDDGAGRQVGRDGGGDAGRSTHGRAEHDGVGARDGPGDVRLDPVGKAQRLHPLQHASAGVGHHDLRRDAGVQPHGAGEGAADMPGADEGQAPEDGFRHGLWRAPGTPPPWRIPRSCRW